MAAVLLAQRLHAATRLTRRALAPVLAVACFRCAAFSAALVGRRVAPESDLLEVTMWLLALAVPLTALGCRQSFSLVGVHGPLHAAAGGEAARPPRPPRNMRLALAEAFDDPSLAIVYRLGDDEGHWGDADGHRLGPPSTPRRVVP